MIMSISGSANPYSAHLAVRGDSLFIHHFKGYQANGQIKGKGTIAIVAPT